MPKPRIGANLFPATGEGSGNAVRAILESGRATAAGIMAGAEGVSRGIMENKRHKRGLEAAEKDRAFRASEAEKGREFRAGEAQLDRDASMARLKEQQRASDSRYLNSLRMKYQEEVSGWDAMAQDMASRGIDPSPAIAKRDAQARTAGDLANRIVSGGTFDPASIAITTPQAGEARAMRMAGLKQAETLAAADLAAIAKRPATTAQTAEVKRNLRRQAEDRLLKLRHAAVKVKTEDDAATAIAKERRAILQHEAGVRKVQKIASPMFDQMASKGMISDTDRAAGEAVIGQGGTVAQAVKTATLGAVREGRMTIEQAQLAIAAANAPTAQDRKAHLDKFMAAGGNPAKAVDIAKSGATHDKTVARQGLRDTKDDLDDRAKKGEDILEMVNEAMYAKAKKGKDAELRTPQGAAERLLPVMNYEKTVFALQNEDLTPQQRGVLINLMRMHLGPIVRKRLGEGATMEQINAKIEEIIAGESVRKKRAQGE